jgi:flagellar protein FlbD
MVHLTRLNNQPLVVNAELIKFVEATPDTVITLITGEKVVVLESVTEVLERISAFRRGLHAESQAWRSWLHLGTHSDKENE